MKNTINSLCSTSPWFTIAFKKHGDGTSLRLQSRRWLDETRVQIRQSSLFSPWRTLPLDLAALETALFDFPIRLAVRQGTEQILAVPFTKVLPSHYEYLPLTDSAYCSGQYFCSSQREEYLRLTQPTKIL